MRPTIRQLKSQRDDAEWAEATKEFKVGRLATLRMAEALEVQRARRCDSRRDGRHYVSLLGLLERGTIAGLHF